MAGSGDPVAVANGLIGEFGSFEATLSAGVHRQRRAAGGDLAVVEALRWLRAAMGHALSTRYAAKPLLSDWQAVLEYLRLDMATSANETVRALYLDIHNRLLADCVVSLGTVDAAALSVRAILHTALDHGASGLILAHNHPSGLPEPSRADVVLTRNLIDAARPLGVIVHDHFVIATSGYVSMKARGLI